MKLRIIASRNPSAIYRFPHINTKDQENIDEDDPEAGIDIEYQKPDGGIPGDMGNRLPSGGRSGNKKIDKFQGYKSPPMY